uniref:Uncharacterized protein n=1 Tax=Rhizophora mucronata TaxID=61149 RepID=A0A2P2QBZ3_RHIMU
MLVVGMLSSFCSCLHVLAVCCHLQLYGCGCMIRIYLLLIH